MTASAISETDNAGALITAPSASISMPSLSNLISVKLSRENFLLWKAQVDSFLFAQNLYGFVDGSVIAPPVMVTEGTGAAVRQVPNPAYLRWFQQNKIVLSALLSSMTEDILGQVARLTTSADVWGALVAMFLS